MQEKINFYRCTCGNSWSAVYSTTSNSVCKKCNKSNISMVSYVNGSKEFASSVIDAELKISTLEEVCQRAYHEIDSNFSMLCDADGYGPMTLVTDLEKIKNGKEYKGMTYYIKALTEALSNCEKSILKNKANKC